MRHVRFMFGLVLAAALGGCASSDVGPRLEEAMLDDLFARAAGYDFGESRVAWSEIERLVRENLGEGRNRAILNARLAGILISPAKPEAKRMACRQLALCGTEVESRYLADMLADPMTADDARIALRAIPGAKVDDRLIDALDDTQEASVAIGIVNTLGERGSEEAAKPVARQLDSEIEGLAEAAAAALGKIGGKRATEALQRARPQATGALALTIDDALISCVEALAADEEVERATEIFVALLGSERKQMRRAALTGLARTRQDQAVELIVETMQSDPDPRERRFAARCIEALPAESLGPLADGLASMTPEAQALTLAALERRGDRSVRGQVEAVVVGGGTLETRIAALQALGVLGTVGSVPAITSAMGGGDELVAAQAEATLGSLQGDDVDAAILDALIAGEGAPAPRAALARVLAERGAEQAAPALLELAATGDTESKASALVALAGLAGFDAAPALIDRMLIETDAELSALAQDAVVAALEREESDARRSEPLLLAYPNTAELAGKVKLLETLGRVRGPKALLVLRKALGESDLRIQGAAIRGMSAWGSDQPAIDLLDHVRGNPDSPYRAEALEGYVRLVAEHSDRPAGELVGMFAQAMEMARDDAERIVVLTQLANIVHPGALDIARPWFSPTPLGQAAMASAATVARGVSGAAPEATRATLATLMQAAPSRETLEHTQGTLTMMEKFEDFIVAWEVSGPYTERGMSRGELLDEEFAPEKGAARANEWRLMPAGLEPGRPYLLDLAQAIGGEDRVAYLRTRVWSDVPRRARLELGSDDAIKAWLNGRPVHTNNTGRGVNPGDDKVDVDLREGWNELMLKIVNGSTDWGACARVAGPAGERLADIRASLEGSLALSAR